MPGSTRPAHPNSCNMIPVALNVVQLELDRCGRPLAASASGASTSPSTWPLSAQQDDAPVANYALGELCRGVLGGGAAAGRHAP